MSPGSTTVLIVADRHPDPDLNIAFLRESHVRLLQGRRAEPETLALVLGERPDLVVEDLPAAVGSPDSFCAMLKADPGARRTPLILVAEQARLPQIRDAGADALLGKPLSPQEFFETVRRWVPLPQRRHLRYAVNLRFVFEWEGRTIQAFSRDISLVGAFLKTDRTVSAGSRLDLVFALPGEACPIHCVGCVRRARWDGVAPRERGLGIEFEGITDMDLSRLEVYVRSGQGRSSWRG